MKPPPFAEIMHQQGMSSPHALDDSIRRALGGNTSTSPEELLKAAEQLLARIIDGECESREAALDLLTVDALVTRSMELAAREPDLLARFPDLAMKRIATR